MAHRPVSYRVFTPEEVAFLQDIHANPRDFAVRRIFGDWLKDRDDPLGEFIHLQVLYAMCDCKPPRGTITRIKQLEREHGKSWRGAATRKHRWFAYGASFQSFFGGLPLVLLTVGSATNAAAKLDAALALRAPSHQLEIAFTIEEGGPDDLRSVFRHPAFGVAHTVHLQSFIGPRTDPWPSDDPISEKHLRQMMECFGERPFRFLFFNHVRREQRSEAKLFQAAAKAKVRFTEWGSDVIH